MIISKVPIGVGAKEMDELPWIEIGGMVPGTLEKIRLRRLIGDSAGTLSIEDFLPGKEMKWAFWHDEMQIVLSGKAEITYTLPPSHREVKKFIANEGDAYLILGGTYATFNVLSDVPYRHLTIIMPRYHYEKWLLEDAVKVPKGDLADQRKKG